MALLWMRSAYADLKRIHEFLEPTDPPVAVNAVRMIVARVSRMARQPRLAERVLGFGDREVRRVLVRRYEVRYEIAGSDLTVPRIFNTREDR